MSTKETNKVADFAAINGSFFSDAGLQVLENATVEEIDEAANETRIAEMLYYVQRLTTNDSLRQKIRQALKSRKT
jgi:hypothetical protein